MPFDPIVKEKRYLSSCSNKKKPELRFSIVSNLKLVKALPFTVCKRWIVGVYKYVARLKYQGRDYSSGGTIYWGRKEVLKYIS